MDVSVVEIEAKKEAISQKKIVIWLHDTKTKSDAGHPVYILRSYSPFAYLSSLQQRNDHLDGDFWGDVLNGYRFCATMQLRTPTNILKSHGRIEKIAFKKLPKIFTEPWQGIWVPAVKTYREIGLDIDEPAIGQMASEVGTISADGGDFLRFMLFAHHIKNENIAYEQKLKWFEIGYAMIGQDGEPFSNFMNNYGDNVKSMASRIMYLSRNA